MDTRLSALITIIILIVLILIAICLTYRSDYQANYYKPVPTSRTYKEETLNGVNRFESFISYATYDEVIYRIHLPDTIDPEFGDRVYNIDIALDINDFLLTDDPESAITRDIRAADDIRVFRLFVYDTTWNPRLLPVTGEVLTLSTDTTVQFESDERTGHDIYLTITPRNEAYVVGVIDVLITSVYPKIQSGDGFRIERVDSKPTLLL